MAEHDLHSTAFPTLDDSQIASLGKCAAASGKSYRDGEVLFAAGQRDFRFFVVKSGEVAIVDYFSGEPQTLVVHHKGQFTGDV